MSDSFPQAPTLDPASLASGTFTRSRRGFEPIEVNQALGQASDAIRTWQLRDRSLQQRIAELESELTDARKLDEGRIASVLGEETVKVISAAREAANEIRSKAETDAAALIAASAEEAEASSSALRAEAEALKSEAESLREAATREYAAKVDEAQNIHDELISTAQSRHAELLSEAERRHEELISEGQTRHDDLIAEADRVLAERSAEAELQAESTLDDAREQGRMMVHEAKDVRDRILSDLAERRKVARRQIEGAVVGRDKVIEIIRQAGLDIEHVMVNLADADEAARDEGNRAADLLLDDSGLFLADLDVELRAAHGDSAEDQIAVDSLIPEAPPAGHQVEMADDSEVVEEGEGNDLDLVDEESVVDHVDADPAAVELADDLDAEADDEEADPAAVELADDLDAEADDEEVELAAVEFADDVDSVDVNDLEPAEGEVTATGTGAGPDPERSAARPDAKVHDLFARIRAEGISPTDDDSAGPSSEVVEDEPVIESPEDELGLAEEVVSEDDEAVVINLSAAPMPTATDLDRVDVLLDSRDELLAPVERQILRALRRLASDEQNEVLDRIRRHKRGLPDFDEVVPQTEEMISAFADGVTDDFAAALRAGFEFWINAGGEATTESFVAPDDSVERLLGVLGGFVGLHRAHLERTLAGAAEAGADSDDLAASIKAVYRDWRQSSLTEMASDLAITGFSYGERIAAGPGAQWLWVVDNGGLPCADGEDNALAGPVHSDEEFPTGDLAPPAHSGCRCILIPAAH